MTGRSLLAIGLAALLGASACTAAPRASPTAASHSATTFTAPAPPPTATETPAPTRVVDLGSDTAKPLPVDEHFVKLTAGPRGFGLLGTDTDSVNSLRFASADGRTWRRVDTRQLGDGALDLAAGPRGWVLVAGHTEGSNETGLTIWWSSDARSWLPVAPAEGMDTIASASVSSGAYGFAIMGTRGPDSGQPEHWIWTSFDGRTWAAGARLPGDAAPEQIVITEDGFVGFATGELGEIPAAWASTDGISWSARPNEDGPLGKDGMWIRAATNGRDIVVLRGDSTVWIAKPRISGTLLGLDWEQASAADPTFAGYRLAALTGSALGYRALGWDRKTSERKAWSSVDGLHWQSARLDTTTFDGGAPEYIAEGDTTTVTLGAKSNADGVAIARPWVSLDGLAWSEVDTGTFGVLPSTLTGPCPAYVPTTAGELEKMAPELWPTCFGHRTLTIRAYVTDCGGCGGADMTDWSPSWLYDPMATAFFLTSQRMPGGTGGNAFGVRIDPAHPVKIRWNVLSDVRGHFDDPAATTCRSAAAEFIGGGLAPPETEIASCRREFVVESIRPVGR